ncbi:hypothetical protein PC41400_15750 [Paenibacillus chitinolyticus]|uniref:Uncharacterized protein n=1 Tax=Paenibacillus chitinolyticus TaxID=79263 RepID=A0A410WXA5_9BACL|nr:hypothetical protein PC41400_15750 [Paenibacillus chitinolyticus]
MRINDTRKTAACRLPSTYRASTLPSGLRRRFSNFGDGMEVLEPGELIADIRQRTEKMRNLYLKL